MNQSKFDSPCQFSRGDRMCWPGSLFNSKYFFMEKWLLWFIQWCLLDLIQFSSVAQLCPTLCNLMNRSMPGLPVHHQLPESIQTHVNWVSDAIEPSHSLSFPSPPASIFPSIRVFSNESALHIRWPKYWSFSFTISPSNEYSGLISFRMGLVGSPCSPRDSQEFYPTPQFKSINPLALSFPYSPLSHPYITSRKTIALTRWTLLAK